MPASVVPMVVVVSCSVMQAELACASEHGRKQSKYSQNNMSYFEYAPLSESGGLILSSLWSAYSEDRRTGDAHHQTSE
eukprot:455380-Prymnesium_polylepis.1